MSLKFYEGVKFTHSNFPKIVQSLDRTMLPVLEHQRNKALAQHLVHVLDGTVKGDYTKSLLTVAEHDWRRITKSIGDDLSLLFSLDFGLHFYYVDGTLLGLAYGSKSLKDAFYSMEEVTQYGYWDNSDPEDCSREEWADRKRLWEHVAHVLETRPVDSTLQYIAEEPLTSLFFKPYGWIYGGDNRSLEAMFACQPSKEDRLNKVLDAMKRQVSEEDRSVLLEAMPTLTVNVLRAPLKETHWRERLLHVIY